MITERASGAVVYQRRAGVPYYLLLKSATSDFWGFPKGHVEGQETDVATAQREIREETALEVKVATEFHADLDYDMANGHHKHVVLFTAEVPTDVVIDRQKIEISDTAWLPYNEARERLTFDNLKGLLDQANDYLVGSTHGK
ncbi:NUDIX family hydrolase [Levilactobacillus paucivorans]|uniref:Bis(5'-nucleosyl)-tetraphosphatase [asymmetrical] n=1 Tax=Levilactobacillus paucivorans TaxID=616990 RepID=A0A0R2LR27_9LACO|nr:bis(5'-nucleosyl)-tetraphosphatase [Levilactobacillus paucivorans]KRO01267.1 NUDIX family hydrolase [Levilactobacillus paucivorans]